MLPATAEMVHQSLEQPPMAILVPEMLEDELVRRRADRFIRFAGAVGVAEQVQVEAVDREHTPEEQTTSLMDSIHRAAWGDQMARKMVEINTRTDMIERTIKAGHIIAVDIFEDDDGNLVQYGQSMESIQANTLRFAADTAAMRERAEAETHNTFRIKQFHEQGLLKDYNFVVISRFPDRQSMSIQEAKKAGFFVDTMSAAIQVTGTGPHGLQTESAFVAGVSGPDAQPHDEAAIIALGQAFEVDYSGKTAAQIIDMPLLIHKDAMPNGVSDLVKLYDQFAGGTFFGQNEPAQDYQAYREQCRQRETALEPAVQAVVEELINQAEHLHTPLEAVEKLDELSERDMVRYSVKYDHSIDPLVFGEEAAGYIRQARAYELEGDTQSAERATERAQETAVSSSCPTARKAANEANEQEEVEVIESPESKAGKIRCIKCREYVNKREVVKAKSWCCPKCKYEVDICNGKVLNEAQPKPQAEPEAHPVAEVISLVDKRQPVELASNLPKEDSTMRAA